MTQLQEHHLVAAEVLGILASVAGLGASHFNICKTKNEGIFVVIVRTLYF